MKQFIGQVIKVGKNKTTVIMVNTFVEHPIYKKRVKRSKKYLAHDDTGSKIGNKVTFQEIKPMSKRKKFKVVAIVHNQKAKTTKSDLVEEAKMKAHLKLAPKVTDPARKVEGNRGS